MSKEQYVDWHEIDSIVDVLSDIVLKSNRKFSTITTLSRGGLIPSRLLADRLGIKTIFVDERIISSNSLFVDDIYDSGKTFEKIISKVDDPSKLFYVVIFARRGEKYPSQLVYGKQAIDDGYVVFPWDKFEFELSQK